MLTHLIPNTLREFCVEAIAVSVHATLQGFVELISFTCCAGGFVVCVLTIAGQPKSRDVLRRDPVKRP